MIKSVIVYQKKENEKTVAVLQKELLNRGIKTKVIRITGEKPEHELFQEIKSEQADLILTLGLAGFDLKTSTEIPSYDVLPGRMGHILLEEEDMENPVLNSPFNFSMYFYVSTQDKQDTLKKKYPELPNVTQMREGNVTSPEFASEMVNQILSDTWLDRELN